MRVCLFTPTFLPAVGGAERDADIVMRGFLERGHEVMVLAQQGRGHAPDLPYPVRRYVRPPLQHLWPEALEWALRRAYRAWPFDVVLAFYGYPNGYAASRLKRKLGFGLVVTPRGGDLYPQYHALRKPRVKKTIAAGYRGADRIVSISHWLTDQLREVAGEPLPPIDLVYNGIDLSAHDAERDEARRHPPDLPVNQPFILHLARVAPVKRQTLAVDAVARLRDVFVERGVQYAIVGEGNGLPAVRQQVQQLELGSIVKLPGTRTGIEKAWLLDHAEFMVSTSREEGLGNVVLEAMASGLPMLASDIGPHRELIGERGWGMLFRSGDPDDLVRQMQAMLDADLQPFADRAMQQREQFTLEAMIDGYEQACLRAHEARPS